jgi:hypothetical protein
MSGTGGIYKTTDGGATWTFSNSIGAYDIFFTDVNNGCAIGYGYDIWKTINGGTTWTKQYDNIGLNRSNAIYFSDANTGYAVGGDSFNSSILKTVNGGITWSEKYSSSVLSTLTSVWFTSNNIGYAVGYEGILAKTIDGGSSWNLEKISDEPLNSVKFFNASIGYITGDYGAILKTTNGTIGVQENPNFSNLTILPNPASNILILNLNQFNDLQNTSVSIYSIQGQLLKQLLITQSQTGIDIHDFPAGLYVVKVNNEKESFISKFVKE